MEIIGNNPILPGCVSSAEKRFLVKMIWPGMIIEFIIGHVR